MKNKTGDVESRVEKKGELAVSTTVIHSLRFVYLRVKVQSILLYNV